MIIHGGEIPDEEFSVGQSSQSGNNRDMGGPVMVWALSYFHSKP